MTFVVANSEFIITDKRATANFGAGGNNDGQTPGISDREFIRDDAVKIVIPKKKVFVHTPGGKYFDENKYAVAIGMSGNYTTVYDHPVSVLIELGNMETFCEMLNNNVFKNTTFCLTALLANGRVAYLRKDNNTENNDWGLTVYTRSSNNTPCLIQHGSGAVDTYIVQLYKEGKISLLELFLYGAHMNDYCSTDYSVYSLNHNHLYTTVRPRAKEVKTVIDKIHRLLSFKGLKEHRR